MELLLALTLTTACILGALYLEHRNDPPSYP